MRKSACVVRHVCCNHFQIAFYAWLVVHFCGQKCVAFGAIMQQGRLKCVASGALPKLETRHSSDVRGNGLPKHLVMHR